jgi:hypothetical protein
MSHGMSGGMLFKVHFNDRLKRDYQIYGNEELDLSISIKDLLKIYYERTHKTKLTDEILNILIRYDFTINNIQLNKDNMNDKLQKIINKDTKDIYILIKQKAERDIVGYNIMKNLLRFISTDIKSQNVVSEYSYNVQSISDNGTQDIDMGILEKNILQQTQYRHISSDYKNINIILYDIAFFTTDENSTPEQIFNLVDLEEREITEFDIINSEKIKKYVKPVGRLFSPNPRYYKQNIAKIYAKKFNEILYHYRDVQIQWYVVNFRTTPNEEDKIESIMKELHIPTDVIKVYGFSG